MKCPRCGRDVKMIAGIKCPKCDHVLGSQNLEPDWSRYDYGRIRPVSGADAQTRPSRAHNPKRRNPLDFK